MATVMPCPGLKTPGASAAMMGVSPTMKVACMILSFHAGSTWSHMGDSPQVIDMRRLVLKTSS